MELFEAIRNRRSCRQFLPEPIEEPTIRQILEAASWAPSPLNGQPWEFIVITGTETKTALRKAAEKCHRWALEKSGWKWLDGYRMDFLTQAPVLIAVVGDPRKTGVDMFQEEGTVAYQHACAAAIQNMLLAAHAAGIGTLWFTFFEKTDVRRILGIPPEKTPLALICAGRPARDTAPIPRKDVRTKTTYL
jgi:nitroreductase